MAAKKELCLSASAPDFDVNRICANACADQESFVRGGPNEKVFLVDEGIEGPKITINVLSSACQQNVI